MYRHFVTLFFIKKYIYIYFVVFQKRELKERKFSILTEKLFNFILHIKPNMLLKTRVIFSKTTEMHLPVSCYVVVLKAIFHANVVLR